MQSAFSNALSEVAAKHVRLSATRHETLCWLALLILRFGTICLWQLAAHVATAAKTDSVRRRFYRFFQHVRLDAASAARMVVELLGLSGKPWVLAIDRTNWDFGRTTINILMVSVLWRGISVPLIWTLLPKAGNSNTAERVDLLDRLERIFPQMRIGSLMGDREFIGNAWMTYLAQRDIPFTLRLRENQYVARDGYATWTLERHAQQLKRGEKLILPGFWRLGAGDDAQHGALRVRIVMLRLESGELLALATKGRPSLALARYRQRWAIETLFGNLKTRGFDMETTHITDARKLETLIAIMAMAATLAAKTGAAAERIRPIPVKSHGRKAVSLFALGLATLRKIFSRKITPQANKFLETLISPTLPIKPLKKLGL